MEGYNIMFFGIKPINIEIIGFDGETIHMVTVFPEKYNDKLGLVKYINWSKRIAVKTKDRPVMETLNDLDLMVRDLITHTKSIKAFMLVQTIDGSLMNKKISRILGKTIFR